MLTDNQKDMVFWISQGLTYKEVALHLRLTEGTIKNQLLRVRKREKAFSTTHLVATALRRGWIQ